MKIQSRIKPEDGKVRNITVFGETYAFTLDTQGRFVAEVTDEEAIVCLLSHDDLYREVEEPAVAAGASKRAKANRAADPVADMPEGQ